MLWWPFVPFGTVFASGALSLGLFPRTDYLIWWVFVKFQHWGVPFSVCSWCSCGLFCGLFDFLLDLLFAVMVVCVWVNMRIIFYVVRLELQLLCVFFKWMIVIKVRVIVVDHVGSKSLQYSIYLSWFGCNCSNLLFGCDSLCFLR